MEKEGLPNAGLYDQRAVLQWIQDNIHLVGGDRTQVSAWGESAGAGSIMHHLVSFGGTQDPLFSKAVMQSPAFSLMFDRKGGLESTFQNFTALAGCAGQGVACLRAASADALNKANSALNTAGPPGSFAVGPSADGNLIRQLASLEFQSGTLPSFHLLPPTQLTNPKATTGKTSTPSSSPTSSTKPTSSFPPPSRPTPTSPPSSPTPSRPTPNPSSPTSKPVTHPSAPPTPTTPPSAPGSKP